jgi:hypothetical protein
MQGYSSDQYFIRLKTGALLSQMQGTKCPEFLFITSLIPGFSGMVFGNG